MSKTNPETQIVRDILIAVNTYRNCGLEAYRMNNTGVFDVKLGCFRKTGQFHPHGLPDIMIVSVKGVLWIEVKTETGKQSPDQVRWQEMCHRYGQPYKICRNKYNALDLLREVGLIGHELDNI